MNTDVVVTATGARGLLSIDVASLRATGTGSEMIPFVEEFTFAGKRLHLFAGGAMANLTAGANEPPGLYRFPESAYREHLSLTPRQNGLYS